ncbi:hypothetical protein B0H14DRAFT_2852092 [Mycena olivaceomarginata]|nr:hypothetical protein B0H14DRAFT_2852092 [Mycena olivaceomarginata]
MPDEARSALHQTVWPDNKKNILATRRCALDTYTILVQYYDFRTFICSGHTIYKVIDMLADTDLDVQQRAVGIITTLACYDEGWRFFYSPPTTSRIFPLLKHLEGRVLADDLITTLVACVTHDDVQNLPSTVERILECLNGTKDSNYLLLMKGLIARQSANKNLFNLNTALTNRIVLKAAIAHAHVRDSYTKLTLMLPPSFTIPYDDRKQLISLLKNPNPTVLNVFGVCMRLLRRQDTATMALDIITEFAKYEDTRSSMIQPTSWIMYELLTMLRAGSTDFDRCQVGLKGLLALGLF